MLISPASRQIVAMTQSIQRGGFADWILDPILLIPYFVLHIFIGNLRKLIDSSISSAEKRG